MKIENYINVVSNEYGQEMQLFLRGKNFAGLNSRYCYDKGVEIGLGAAKAFSGLVKVQKNAYGVILEVCNNILGKLIKTGLVDAKGNSVKSAILDKINHLGFEKCNITDSIMEITRKALENAPGRDAVKNQINQSSQLIQSSQSNQINHLKESNHSNHSNQSNQHNPDTIIFGDMHGQLDLFLQNLYIAGIIDENASVVTREKPLTVVLNGDTVDNGAYEMEGMIMLRAIIKSAEEKNVRFVCLVGNHDSVQLIFSRAETKEREMMRKLMISDIQNDKAQIAYADDENNFLCFHGGMQKVVLIKTLMNMSSDSEYKDKMKNNKDELYMLLSNLYLKRNLKREENPEIFEAIKEKVSSERIYRDFVYGNGINLSDIANYMNRSFKDAVKDILKMDNRVEMQQFYTKFSYLFLKPNSILYSRKKAGNVSAPGRGEKDLNEYINGFNETKYNYKPTQFVGHNCTGCPKRYGYGVFGGIMQNKATVYTDVGLAEFFGAKQAFVNIDKKMGKAYAVEIVSGNESICGLDKNNLSVSIDKKLGNIRVRELSELKLRSIKATQFDKKNANIYDAKKDKS